MLTFAHTHTHTHILSHTPFHTKQRAMLLALRNLVLQASADVSNLFVFQRFSPAACSHSRFWTTRSFNLGCENAVTGASLAGWDHKHHKLTAVCSMAAAAWLRLIVGTNAGLESE